MPAAPPPEAGPRARLVRAMAEAIAARDGFARVTVADVVAAAHTSRRTFYEHFEDREACFLALFDELSAGVLAAIARGADVAAPAPDRVRRGLQALVAAVAGRPLVARACFVELPGLGPRGAGAVRAMDERWARHLVEVVAADPAARALSADEALVLTAGLRHLAVARLDAGEGLGDLPATGAGLVRRLTA